MRADRDKRAAVLTAEGARQSAILTAEGEKQAAILTAEGEKQAAILRAQAQREAAILRAEGEAQAISTVFNAIHQGRPDQALLSYQYLQMLPQIAQGDSNKLWIVPSEIGKALEGLGSVVGKLGDVPAAPPTPQATDGDGGATAQREVAAHAEAGADAAVASAESEVAAAIAAAEDAAKGGLAGKGRRRATGGDGPADGAAGVEGLRPE
jgi:hypothetical protein